MKIKDTIFEDKEKVQFNKIWEDNKLFKYLNEEQDKVMKDLDDLGIKKVIAFDQISANWEDWVLTDKLTLAILPTCNIVDQDGKNTKQLLIDLGYSYSKNHLPVDINSTEDYDKKCFVYYFKTRNLIIVSVNPFYEKSLYQAIISEIKDLYVKYMSEEDIHFLKLENQFKAGLLKREDNLIRSIESSKSYIKEYKESYINSIKSYNENIALLKHVIESKNNLKKLVSNELKEVKRMPAVKNLLIRDNIYFDFGNIFLTGSVITGRKKNEDNIEVPTTEIKKIEIGTVKFVLGNGEIKVVNYKSVKGYEHPHACGGKICFGEEDLKVASMIANFEIVKLVKFLYSWVYSYNQTNAYITLQEFYDKRVGDEK